MNDSEVTTCYISGAAGFGELVRQVGAGDWSCPALGSWDVRGLVGHASRALSTVEDYLAGPVDGTPLGGPADYYLAGLPVRADPARREQLDRTVARRGVLAGEHLGPDPAVTFDVLAARVIPLVRRTPPERVLTTAAGPMKLADYLPTRTFELAVHGLDLARALALPVPAALRPAIAASCALAGQVAGLTPDAAEFLLALTGRTGHRPDLAVV